MTLSGATTPNQSGSGSDGKEGVLHISQSSNITGTLPLDCLMSCPGHSLGGVLPLCRDVISVFYCPSRLGPIFVEFYKIRFLTFSHRIKLVFVLRMKIIELFNNSILHIPLVHIFFCLAMKNIAHKLDKKCFTPYLLLDYLLLKTPMLIS